MLDRIRYLLWFAQFRMELEAKTIYSILVTGYFLYHSLWFDRAGNLLFWWSVWKLLASGKELTGNWQAHDKKPAPYPCVVTKWNLCITKNVFVIFTPKKTSTYVLRYEKTAFIYSLANILWFYNLGGGIRSEVGIGLRYSQRGCWGCKSEKVECGNILMRDGFILVF